MFYLVIPLIALIWLVYCKKSNNLHQLNSDRYALSTNESGNIFFAIFGAVALLGILAAGTMTFIKGPLATSVKLNRQNVAENQMMIGAQVAVMSAASQANSGDCDSDAFVEPVEWRDAGALPKPTGGGLVPASVGIAKKDPWGTEYGYCGWDHGPQINGGGTCGGSTQKRLSGGNTNSVPVVALISAGPDKVFSTTCRSFATADVNNDGDLLDATDLTLVSKAVLTDDDVIFSYTYQEATAAAGGLWSLKSGDAGTAVIDKNIETMGVASLQGGVLLPDKSFITCDATTAGVMAMNGTAIEICNGTSWDAITGGGAAGSGLVLSPNTQSAMNVTGGCGTPTCYSSNIVFTLTNNLSPAATSATLVTSLSNTANFEFVSNGCDGVTIATGANCQMVVRAKASGNVSYAGTLNVVGNNSPLATLDGVASGFAGCNAGGQGPGGYYVACGVAGGYNLIVTPSNCTGGNTNPTCSGGNGDVSGLTDSSAVDLGLYAGSCCAGGTSGQLNTATLQGYSGGMVSFPAASYCDGMVYGGYDDWFLPSIQEIAGYFYPVRNLVGWAANGNYVSSTIGNHAFYEWKYLQGSNGSIQQVIGTNNGRYVRCMRRDPAAAITPVPDTAPIDVVFTNSSTTTAGSTLTSNGVTVYGVTSPIAVSITGGTGAAFSKNGGGFTNTPTTVTNGDTIRLQATSPTGGGRTNDYADIG